MSDELVRLSDLLWELQLKLRKHFGVQEILVGGASSLAILDHVWHREPIALRDLDVYVVRGTNVDREYAQAMAEALQSERLGSLHADGVTPHVRGNPALPFPERDNYQSGWGFDLVRGPQTVDMTLYHSENEVPLNGIFSFDMVKLRLLTDQPLVDCVRSELRRFSYEQLLVSGVLRDLHGGYSDWRKKMPRVVNWYEIERDCVLSSVRVVRSLGKIGCENVPPDIVRFLRPRLERRPQFNAKKFAAALERMKADPTVVVEKRMLKQVGTLDSVA